MTILKKIDKQSAIERIKEKFGEGSSKFIFLVLFMENPHVGDVTKIMGIHRTIPYNWTYNDPAFKEEWDKVKPAACQSLIDEAIRRARDGVDEPVFYRGEQVGTVKKYSDTLLIFLIKAWSKEHDDRFRRVDVTTQGKPITQINYIVPEKPKELDE